MSTISHFMEGDHRRCDELFAAVENLVAAGEWQAAASAYEQFHTAMEHHLAMEEQELFPAFEQASGSTMGPTQVMRMEHRQMRDLFAAMRSGIEHKDADEYLGAGETLLILMQQHNMKEEHILYPMAERALQDEGEIVLRRMQDVP